uniref:Phospholipase C-beta C-terminal domain-containing protein n=1 Tax=Plectus sambesii TaxID=2011161 RepID=A0A914VKT4_9BILA
MSKFIISILNVEAINVADLRKDKTFVKLSKVHQRDLESMKKRHQKQRDTIQKQQQTNVDKLMSDSHKQSKKKSSGSSFSSNHSHASLDLRDSDPTASVVPNANNAPTSPNDLHNFAHNQKMRSLVVTQTTEWSELMRRQQQEEHELRRVQMREEWDLLRKLMTEAQKLQMAMLRSRLDTEIKDLKLNQTKKSIEDARVIQQDKSIKTKAEKDRRVKELNEKNVKMFLEERRRQAVKSQKHEEQLTKRHQDQTEALEKEAAKTLEQEDMNYRETLLASKPETVV